MSKVSKRRKKIEEIVANRSNVAVSEAVEILKKCPAVKFDQTVEISLRLGVDPRKSDQQVRGTVSLPHGTGKKVIVLVLAKGDQLQAAIEAGADFVGNEEYIHKIEAGWTDFNAVIATPDMMREVGKLGKVLGPRGLMPTPKAGTVTKDVAKAVREIKAGKVEFKVDKSSVVNIIVGKLSFSTENLVENTQVLLNSIVKAKPSTAKGNYLLNCVISSTMGPGIKLDLQSFSM